MDTSTAEFSCHLCSKTNSIMKQIIYLKNHNTFDTVFEWLTKNEPRLNNEDLICSSCIKQIQRNHNKAFSLDISALLKYLMKLVI